MAGLAAQAIGVHIPLWHLAAAMPFVIIACVVVVTPGGLGVNELSYATMLHLFGTPLNVGAQWALANRFLVASSCFVVAGCATGAAWPDKVDGCRDASRSHAGKIMTPCADTNRTSCLSHCTVCGGGQWRFVREGNDLYQAGDDSRFDCTAAFPAGRSCRIRCPQQISSARRYSAEYAPYRPAWKESGWPLWKILRELTTSRRLRRLGSYGTGDKLLEVGCGAGDFLHAVHGLGWEVKRGGVQ